MKHVWIEDVEDFKKIAKEWDSALVASGEDNPFLLSTFILIWWKHYSPRLRLRIFAVYDGKTLVGGIPLCLDRNGRLLHVGGIYANYTECMSGKGAGNTLLELYPALLSRKDWRLLRLDRYRKDRLGASAPADLLCDISETEKSYLITVPKDFSGYIDTLPKKLRYYIRKAEEKLSGLGNVSLDVPKSRSDVLALADKYMQLSRVSFKKRGRRSAFVDGAKSAFFKDLVTGFYNSGYLDANSLRLDGRVIAIHFGYSIGNNLNYVFPVFDIEFAASNPGHLLIYKMVELASKRGNELFDLYTGYQFYKEQWSDRKDEVVSLELRPDDARGRFGRLSGRLAGKCLLKEKLKKLLRVK